MSIDPKFVQLTADVLEIFFYQIEDMTCVCSKLSRIQRKNWILD